jgi:hypothetical protein
MCFMISKKLCRHDAQHVFNYQKLAAATLSEVEGEGSWGIFFSLLDFLLKLIDDFSMEIFDNFPLLHTQISQLSNSLRLHRDSLESGGMLSNSRQLSISHRALNDFRTAQHMAQLITFFSIHLQHQHN